MYVAAYIDGRLCGVYAETNIKEHNVFGTPEGAEEVKIFIWDKNMKPIARKN